MIDTTHTAEPMPSGHFAVEIPDWDEMIANLDKLGVPYNTRTRGEPAPSGSNYGRREYSGGYSTYIQDRMGTPLNSCTIRWGRRTPRGTRSSSLTTPKA